jgi:hypothetical protein
MASILEKPSIRQAAMPISVAQYHRLSEQCVEIFRDPSPGGYRSHTVCTDPNATLSPQVLPAAGMPVGRLLASSDD